MESRKTNWPSVSDRESPFSKSSPDAAPFLLVVITTPHFFAGEAACLEGLLAAGLEKLHLRKPGAGVEELEALLKQINARWYPRLVLHGGYDLQQLAARYGIHQVHCPQGGLRPDERLPGKSDAGELRGEPAVNRQGKLDEEYPIVLSTSIHSWEEIKDIEGAGLTYVFLSPVFNSISKSGYAATPGLLRRPAGPFPCKVIGLGGVDKDTIGELQREGWDGAAVLGWIWQRPEEAVQRYQQLKDNIKSNWI